MEEPEDDDGRPRSSSTPAARRTSRPSCAGAVDDLPLEFHRALEHVAVVVYDGGRRRRAYGLYQGGTVARDGFHDRIVIFRDTLVRDFGHDPALLKRAGHAHAPARARPPSGLGRARRAGPGPLTHTVR